MHSEQRKEVRSVYPPQPKGKLQVLVNDRHFSVTSVKDISPTGIRLEIRTPISIGENIMIRFVGEKVDIKLNGTVAWNSISAGDSADSVETSVILIGVKLTSPSLLQVIW